MTAAAFFDLDNTLLRGSSMIHLAVGFYRRGYFTNRTVVEAFLRESRFRQTGVESERDIEWARQVALAAIAGKPVSEIERDTADIFDTRLAKRIWPGTRQLADAHLAAGIEVWVVTGSPREVAEIVADRFGFTGGLGTRAERRDGHYTGQLDIMLHGQAKADAVAALIKQRGLTATECFAYSDSSNDLPLLRLIGHPSVINPDPTLRKVASAHDWPAHDFVRRHRTRNWVGMGAATSVAVAGYLARRRRKLALPGQVQLPRSPEGR